MADGSQVRALIQALNAVGVRTHADRSALEGFPLVLNLAGGASVTLEVPEPGILSLFDPETVGLTIVDPAGYPRARWGLAEKLDVFECMDGVLETPIGPAVESAMLGKPGAQYHEGHRYLTARLEGEHGTEVLVMVTDASEEEQVRLCSERNARSTAALKRIGRALTSKQTLQTLAITATHAISSATELAAALLWVRARDGDPMSLVASVGTNRAGTAALAQIDVTDGQSCVAELAACTRQTLMLADVSESPLTADLEGSFCYLPPGGLMVIPLLSANRLIGVLELVGRADDESFVANEDLFTTIGEHLSLALSSAIMFEDVERLAAFDALTSISNHRTMQEFLHKRVSEASRSETNVGVIMLDVDHFRNFNEEEGHDAGDQVLKIVADVLSDCVRTYDMAARYGGEEFTLVLPGSNREMTYEIAERARKTIAGLTYRTRSGQPRQVTASFGCAIYPACAQDAVGLLKAADTALFKAKREGRNRTVMYDGHPVDPKALVEEDHGRIWQMVPEQDIAAAERFSQRAEPYIEHLDPRLDLSASQTAILRAASVLAVTYTRLSKSGAAADLEAFDRQQDLRTVAPSLEGMLERFDGQGPKSVQGQRIPLLGRVMAVLDALLTEMGAPISQDPGRFDPAIVAAIEDFSDAA
ncbi:MAG: diguanylate cyclase [Armatimonadetes bacterium]|nr:diguanylate cyclase [Armatimonadota bacterium]